MSEPEITLNQSTARKLQALLPERLQADGFSRVSFSRPQRMTFLEALAADGGKVTMWVKADWTGGVPGSAAIPFSSAIRSGSSEVPDEVFAQQVDAQVAKERGAGSRASARQGLAPGQPGR